MEHLQEYITGPGIIIRFIVVLVAYFWGFSMGKKEAK